MDCCSLLFDVVYLERKNSRCFEGSEHSVPDLKHLFFITLLDWFSVWRNQPFSSVLDLLDLYNFCIWYVHPCMLHVCLGVSFFYINKFLLLIKKIYYSFYILDCLLNCFCWIFFEFALFSKNVSHSKTLGY